MIYFHGNGEVTSKACLRSEITAIPNLRDMFDCAPISQLIVMEYRGYGPNTGSSPSISSTLTDAEDLFHALQFPPERVIVFGRSIGSIPAVHLAGCHPNIAGLIIESGMADPVHFVHSRVSSLEKDSSTQPSRTKMMRDSGVEDQLGNHIRIVADFPGNVLILHTADDETFSFDEHALRLFRRSCGIADESQDLVAESRLQTADDAPGGLRVVRRGDRVKMLCRFDYGGHNWIWPLNWRAYSSCVQAIVAAAMGAPEGSEGLCERRVDAGWWEGKSQTIEACLRVDRGPGSSQAALHNKVRCSVS